MVHSCAAPMTLAGDQLLQGDVVLPGFEVRVRTLFPENV